MTDQAAALTRLMIEVGRHRHMLERTTPMRVKVLALHPDTLAAVHAVATAIYGAEHRAAIARAQADDEPSPPPLLSRVFCVEQVVGDPSLARDGLDLRGREAAPIAA